MKKKNSEKTYDPRAGCRVFRFRGWMNKWLVGSWNRNLNPPERITRGHALAQHGAKF
jgi:hypothetical protein